MNFLIALLISANVFAFDVVDATVLCDRFIGGPERDQCMTFVKSKKPDTYVSSVCHYLFDDKVFNDCLKLAIRMSANPKALSLCSDSEMADKDRLNCIRNSSRAGKDFQRIPASFPKNSKAQPSSSGTKVYPESKAGL